MLKLFNPFLFQGNINKKDYFEGYYYKIVTNNFNLAIIAGVNTGKDKHCFIQLIINNKSYYFFYPINQFASKKNKLSFKIENNLFSDQHIILNLCNKDLIITANFKISESIKYPRAFFHKGIMGPFIFIPFMECKHDIILLNSKASGVIKLNNVDFKVDGLLYLEKDYGYSFPISYIWLQGNNEKNSFMLSVAKIPFLNITFKGIISYLFYNGIFINLSTYNGAKIVDFQQDKIIIKNKKYKLTIIILDRGFASTLKAPEKGIMNVKVQEALNGKVKISLEKGKNLLFEEIFYNCGIELTWD